MINGKAIFLPVYSATHRDSSRAYMHAIEDVRDRNQNLWMYLRHVYHMVGLALYFFLSSF
jgi:hypothetical protein